MSEDHGPDKDDHWEQKITIDMARDNEVEISVQNSSAESDEPAMHQENNANAVNLKPEDTHPTSNHEKSSSLPATKTAATLDIETRRNILQSRTSYFIQNESEDVLPDLHHIPSLGGTGKRRNSKTPPPLPILKSLSAIQITDEPTTQEPESDEKIEDDELFSPDDDIPMKIPERKNSIRWDAPVISLIGGEHGRKQSIIQQPNGATVNNSVPSETSMTGSFSSRGRRQSSALLHDLQKINIAAPISRTQSVYEEEESDSDSS
ncbi:hypothetical protein HDU91_006259, partial [Kappamyces sp. JEL0680]